MNRQRSTLLTRIYTWIYETSDYRQNNYIPLEREHRPRNECWDDDVKAGHISHMAVANPSIQDLANLGNYLSDRTNWLFEIIGNSA